MAQSDCQILTYSQSIAQNIEKNLKGRQSKILQGVGPDVCNEGSVLVIMTHRCLQEIKMKMPDSTAVHGKGYLRLQMT